MLSLLYLFLLTLHLIAMNVAAGGPLVCLWVEWRLRGRKRSQLSTSHAEPSTTNDENNDTAAGAVAAERLAAWSFWLLIGGILLGFALMAWAWGEAGGLREALVRFPAKAYWYASGELVFSALCTAAYWWFVRRRRARFGWHGVFALLSATNLLYHFPPLMAILGSLAAVPDSVSQEQISRPVVRELMLRPDILAATVHFWIASLAVSGVALMLIALRLDAREGKGASTKAEALIVSGGRIALVATAVQLLVGTWLLVAQRPAARNAVMGDDLLATGLLLAALGTTFVLLHGLAAIALGKVSPNTVRNCAAAMALVILLMLGALVRMRAVSAGPLSAVGQPPPSSGRALVAVGAREQPRATAQNALGWMG